MSALLALAALAIVAPGATTAVAASPFGAFDAAPASGLPSVMTDTPGTPTAVIGDASAAISWGAPAAPSSPVVYSVVTASPGGATCRADGTTCTLTGLTNGTAYTATVRTVRADGTSASSDPSASFTPLTTPTTPRGLQATTQPGRIDLSWTAPLSTGGTPIGSYRVELQPEAGGLSGVEASIVTGTTASFTGLSNGTTYVASVSAITLAGTGPEVTTRATPSADRVRDGVIGTVYSSVRGSDGTMYLGGIINGWGPQTGPSAVLTHDNGTPSGVDRAFPAVLRESGGAGGVAEVTPDGSGGYYIGGNFTSIGGVARSSVAHVLADGSIDPAFAPEVTGSIGDMALSGTTLYLSGTFTAINGTSRAHLAAVNASTGELLPFAPTIASAPQIAATADGALIIGGSFTSVNGESRTNLAALDSSGQLLAWNPAPNGTVHALTVSGETAYVGGKFTSVSGATQSGVAAFSTADMSLNSWNPNLTIFDTGVYDIAVSGDTIYLAGGISKINGATRYQVGAVDATTAEPTSFAPVVDTSTSTTGVYMVQRIGDTVFVGGNFSRTFSGQLRRFGVAFTAAGALTSWNPRLTSNLTMASDLGAGRMIIAGAFRGITETPRDSALAIAPDGTLGTWAPSFTQAIGTATPNIRNLHIDGTTIYAAGYFTAVNGNARSYLAAVDTTGALQSWNPSANGQIFGMAVMDGLAYVRGSFTTIGGINRSGLAAVSLGDASVTSWAPTVTGSVSGLDAHAGVIYLAGAITAVNGTPRTIAAAVDSTGALTDWAPTGLSGSVYFVRAAAGTTYVGFLSTVRALSQATGAQQFSVTPVDTAQSALVDGDTVYLPLTGYFTPATIRAASSSRGQMLTWGGGGAGGATYTATMAPGNSVFIAGNFSPQNLSSQGVAAFVPGVAVPGAPENATARVSDAGMVASWTAPANDGGSAVSDYRVTASPGGATCTSSTTSCTFAAGALDAGTTYAFSVSARNTIGFGPDSSAAAATMASVPTAPSATVATPGPGAASIDWSAPAADGGAPVIAYTATVSPGGHSCVTSGTSCTITGLSNGTTYTATVTATNAVGTSAASDSASVTPVGAPGAPAIASLTPGIKQIAVSITPPEDTGGSAITSYVAYADINGTPAGQCTADGITACTITGLEDATSYRVRVSAVNSAGEGALSDPASATTFGVPGAPTISATSIGDGQATVTWSAPSDGGLAISGYVATAQPGGQACSPTVHPDRCTITGLTNGATYAVSVVATNALGPGPASDPVDVTPGTVPGPVRNIAAARLADGFRISWEAPATDGGYPVTAYAAEARIAGQPQAHATCTTTGDLTCDLTGLTPGETYFIAVVATNAIGEGPPEYLLDQTIASAPGAPTSVQAARADGALDITWTAPTENGGIAITSYIATAQPGGATCEATDASGCRITGLANGTEYQVTVTATNPAGTGPASDPATGTPATVPGAPTGVSVSPGPGTISASWNAPGSDGGDAIRSYTATAQPGGATCETLGQTACEITGLVPGTAYTVTVAAANGVGEGPSSDPSASVVPYTTPDAPLAPVAAAGDATARVRWVAPVGDGGSPVTGYEVISSPGGITCATDGALNCDLMGLANGTTYTFTVRAINAAGPGPASASTDPVTPRASTVIPEATAPGVPTALVAVAGDTRAQVTWTAPENDGGAPVARYLVTASPGGQTCVASWSTSCTVGGLANGTEYTFTAQAITVGGISDPSTPSNAVTPEASGAPGAGVPGAPRTVSAEAGNARATVIWAPPISDGGSSVISYRVTALPGGATCTSDGATTCQVTGLANGTAYAFIVTAANAQGEGEASAPSAAVVPMPAVPGAPLVVTARAGDTRATVSWIAPSSDGGAPITGYEVTSTPAGGECTTTGATTCEVTGLANGTSYTFSVRARNMSGLGALSLPADPVTPESDVPPTPPATIPGAPTGATGIAADGEIIASWTAPSDDGGDQVSRYLVTASPGGATCEAQWTTTCRLAGLANGTAYTFTVRAMNSAGFGPASDPADPVVPVANEPDAPRAPGAPTGVVLAAGTGSLVASWSAPASDGGSPITGYTAQAIPGGATCTTAGATTCEITGLANGTAYTVVVVATNSAGDSVASAPSAPLAPVAPQVPGAPTDAVATAGDASAKVSWTAPALSGSSPITGYRVVATPGGKTCTTDGATQCTVDGLANGTAYTFRVVAISDAGESAWSDPTAPVIPAQAPTPAPEPAPTPAPTPADPVPSLVITKAPPALSRSTRVTTSFSATPGATILCRVYRTSPGAFEPCGADQIWPALADGEWTLQAFARNGAGESAIQSATFTVDTTAPELRITKGPDRVTSLTTARFQITAEEGASLTCTLNGRPLRSCTTSPSFRVARGKHVFTIRATDRAGNESRVESWSWQVASAPVYTGRRQVVVGADRRVPLVFRCRAKAVCAPTFFTVTIRGGGKRFTTTVRVAATKPRGTRTVRQLVTTKLKVTRGQRVQVTARPVR